MGEKVVARNILELTHTEAKDFFLKEESYNNFDLPQYIKFAQILSAVDAELNGKNLSDYYQSIKYKTGTGEEKNKPDSPKNYENVNYKILNNKDGRYAWRPMQLIHPALYVSLVHKITDKKNWETIQNSFKEFYKNPKIVCKSLPSISSTDDTDKATQINHWLREVEQGSIRLALDYEHLVHTDIADCYGSIYTHSVAWALHTKQVAKANIGNYSLVGNVIDKHLQDMSHGQTNGIPQGSVLMDFIAEMILGYADLRLSKEIAGKITDYHIIRYRDDYRIFTNSTQDGEIIVKIITEILIELGLKLSPQKTIHTSQVISASIKGDKLHWINQKQREKNLQDHLLIIHELSNKFPNSGSVQKALNKFFKRIHRIKKLNRDVVHLISIVVDIAYRNPKTYPTSTAILSKFIEFLEGDDQKREIFKRIRRRFNKIPNTGHMMIWLQRISLTFDKDYQYDEPICQLAAGKQVQIWNSE
jgi:Reverse transcriptase (RNA-dependent DNA polymerase)